MMLNWFGRHKTVSSESRSGVVGAVQLGALTEGYVLRTAGDVSILHLNERYADTGQVVSFGYHCNSAFVMDAGIPCGPVCAC